MAVWGATSYSSDGCSPWVDSTYGYSVCLPDGWYRRVLPSGAVFLCDEQRGGCTRPVGGGPLLGHATISLVPVQVALSKAPETLEAFAHRIADKDSSSQFSGVVAIADAPPNRKYLVVAQTFTSGARNDLPQLVYRYFAQADQVMLELILTFNSGDKRSQTYRETALDIITSVKPRQ
jgi:hypothetical protein